MRRPIARWMPALALALALTGCSQVAAIAPVGGSHLAEVRFAGNDVLVAQQVQIRTAPVCAETGDKTVTCDGDTVDGDPIRVMSPGSSPDRLTVTVGSRSLYDGLLQDVLEKAMEDG